MTHNKKMSAAFVLLLILLLVIVCLMTSGCAFLKGKETKVQDTTKVEKVDSGSVKTTSSNSTMDWEWFKTTLQYPQVNSGGDTTINNFYPVPAQQSQQPQVIIMEGGKGKQEQNTVIVDSSWKDAFRALVATVTETKKTKETQGLSWLHIIGVCAGTALLLIILQTFSKYKLAKK